MKWTNKGHELDENADKLSKIFCFNQSSIYIFGAGIIGKEISAVIRKAGCFGGYIDNDQSKQNNGVNGERVYSLQEYIENEKKGIIVIAADKRNIPFIEQQLTMTGLLKDRDFFGYDNFMKNIFPLLSLYGLGKLYVELAQICLTERCSLKCKKCAHGCYAVDFRSQDMSIEMAEKSADYFFDYVDIIKEFVLIGGEPFLYQNIGRVIEYIGKRYRDRMVTFSVATNGSIVPEPYILDLCKRYDVTIRISDYSNTIKWLENKYNKLIADLIEKQVLYSISNKDATWIDYGFENVDRKGGEEELIHVFDKCKTPCREIRGNKYYYCVMARSVSDNLKFGLSEDGFLDLDKLDKKDKRVFLEFQMGYSDKGYLDMCNHCNGSDAVNYPIPAAEQV